MAVNVKNGIFGNSPVVTEGLVTYLDAINNVSYISGSSTWADLTRLNNGTLISASYNTDAGGNLIFSGSSAFVTMSSEFNLTNWTYNGWYRYNYDPTNLTLINPLVSSGNKSGTITWTRGIFTGLSTVSFDTTGSIYFGTFGMGVWDSRVARGIANQLANTKWGDSYQPSRGKANPMW